MDYPYKTWGFGEAIGLRALRSQGGASAAFVHDLVRDWCLRRPVLSLADHVAPGTVLLDLHEETGDPLFLDAAQRLGALHRSFDEVDGIPVHRPDLPGLAPLIWVDCLALDGPFLAGLARVTGDADWAELALRGWRAYDRVLRDPADGLYRHGYDTAARRRSACAWGRGNGWAMHGLVDTMERLPRDHPARPELHAVLEQQAAAVLRLQHPGGLWHTILDDPKSPLENSTAAFFLTGLLKAMRLRLWSPPDSDGFMRAVDLAAAAMRRAYAEGPGLLVSFATPVGGRETYVRAPLGLFPWGEGPRVLAELELRRAAEAVRPSEGPPPASLRGSP